MQQELKKL